MSEFQPIPVFKNEGQINQTLIQWDDKRDYFQAIVNQYKKLNIEAPLLQNDLVEMTNKPKDFLVKKITKGNGFSLGNIKLEADKAFDLLEKPDGSLEFIDFIEASKKQSNSEKWFFRHAYFFIITDGLVEIDPKELEKINTQNTVFLTSQKEKDIYDLLVSLCESINSLNKIQHINHVEEHIFTNLIEINPNTSFASIKDNFLKFYNI